MNTVTLNFRAEGQKLTPLDGIYKYASNTVEYIRAVFDLGDNWTDFDVVRAAWFTDYDCIVTVLDPDGVCMVPAEVLNKRAEVTVNLFGCDVVQDELVDRLTTYPVKAILIDANARVCGSETGPVTPSQFEQFIAIVEDLVHTVRDIDRAELNPDYTLTIYYTDGTSDTVGPIRGEQGPVGPTGNGISKIEKVGTAGLVDTYRITYTNGQTYEYTVTNGAQGPQGNGIVSIYKSGESGAVKTYTILFTDGNTFEYNVTDGEVTFATLEQLMPKDTASGDIASFPDGQAVFPLKSCLVDIDPVQDLHGYDKPWVGGAGKNKINVSSGSGSVMRGVTPTYDNDGGLRFQGTVSDAGYMGNWTLSPALELSAGTYTLSMSTALPYALILLSGWSEKANINAGNTSVTFTLSATTTIDKIVSTNTASVGQSVDFTAKKIQIESGSTATSYAPYSNICPISGHDEVEISVVGKNLFDVDNVEIGTAWNGNSNSARARLLVPVKPNKKYTISMSGTSTLDGVYSSLWADSSTPVSVSALALPRTFTTGSDKNILCLQFNKTAIAKTDVEALKLQLELGETATEYEPYNGQTYTTTLPSTTYGGTLDLVSGVLTVTMVLKNLGTLDWTLSTAGTYNRFYSSGIANVVEPPSASSVATTAICSQYKAVTFDTAYGATEDGVMAITNIQSGAKGNVNIVDSRFSDTAAFKLAMDGVQLVYPLATPQTYQLDPVQVACLLGRNNAWADCGAVAVRYIADIGLYIVKKTS